MYVLIKQIVWEIVDLVHLAPNRGRLWKESWIFGFHEIQEISWPAVLLSSCQEELAGWSRVIYEDALFEYRQISQLSWQRFSWLPQPPPPPWKFQDITSVRLLPTSFRSFSSSSVILPFHAVWSRYCQRQNNPQTHSKIIPFRAAGATFRRMLVWFI
jgi:hypothetical protein